MTKQFIFGIVGALLGAVLGHFVFGWALRQGFYAMILPGALIGFGASVARCQHLALPIFCAVLALVVSLLTEWRFRPFVTDKSLAYFLTHVHQLKPVGLAMMAVGTALAFWLPFRFRRS